MAFSVISIVPGLAPDAFARARENAPPFTDAPAPYAELLHAAGWAMEACVDVTDEFAEVTARDLRAHEARVDRLRDLFGDAEHARRVEMRRTRIELLEAGHVRRELFAVRRPR